MTRVFLVCLVLTLFVPAFGQVDSTALRYAATITQAELRTHLTILASDEFEGRETGMKGEKLAADYIVDQFKSYGIPPVPQAEERGMMSDGYRQQFPLIWSKMGGLKLDVDGRERTFMEDYFYFNEYLQRGLEASEVMVITPVTAGGTRLGGGSKVVMMLDDGNESTNLFSNLKSLAKTLTGTGTEVLLLVNDNARALMASYGQLVNQRHMRLDETTDAPSGLQVVVITPELAQTILDRGHLNMKKALKTAGNKRVVVKVPIKFTYNTLNERLTGENVLGYIEGSDLKDELVVVTAHYDHIGVLDGEVHNGADDDGSGTVAVLAMAQALAKAKAEGHGPRRSMLFMTVSGEEKGLLGSEWYTDHPVFPLDHTVADLNIDMIGRVDTVYGDSSSYVYVIGSKRISNELGGIIEQQNALYTKLDLDYTFDSDSDPNRFYFRSDHYNFAKHGIPIAFFFNGVHKDYHGPYDEVDKIRFDLLRKRALLVFHSAWEVANRNDRPKVD